MTDRNTTSQPTSPSGKNPSQVRIGLALLAALLLPPTAQAYGPSTMYTPPSSAPAPGALYARAMQASNGRMYATFEQYTTGVAMFPIFESLDSGRTWTKVGDVKDTHKGVGMRWEPQLYELPQAIGNMPAGTLLASGLVLPYNRSNCQIDLYKSNDAGRTWIYVSTVAVGTQANPGSDPVWEPFLMVANNKLYVFYSDERDPAYSQKLVHQSSSDGVTWSSVVNDVAVSGQRPGMVSVAKMPNGNFIMTYEIVGVGGAWFKTSSNIENWNAPDRGTMFDANGSSPNVVTMNGTILISSAGTGNLYTNSNNAVGNWTQISCPIGTAYSRAIVPLNNGRIFVIGAGWNGTGLNKVTYADMAFGCTPSAITPSTKIDGGAWRTSSSDTVKVGSTILLGPQPVAATGWTWTGPNGFTATSREVTLTNVSTANAGVYTATYTNPSGCKSTQKFTVTVNPTTSILIGPARGSRGAKRMRLFVGDNLSFEPYDGNSVVRITNAKGVSVFQSSVSDGELLIPRLQSGVYIVDISRSGVVLERKSFLIE